MMHEALALLRSKAIEHLLLAGRTERNDTQHLRLPASKDSRAMSARKQSNLTSDGTNRPEITPIGTCAMIQNIVAHVGFEFFFVERDDILEAIRILCAERRYQLVLN